MTREASLQRLLFVLILTLFPGVLAAQRVRPPDSPTGRAAGAWLDLLAEPPPLQPEGFAARWLTAEAAGPAAGRLERLLAECRGARLRGIRNSGPRSASIELARADGSRTCRIAFELEPNPPHRIASWTADVEAGGAEPGADPGHHDPSGALPALEIPAQGDVRAAVAGWLTGLAERELFSGSVLVARDGELLFEGAYGLADREAPSPATPRTRYDVGSITKAFTKVAVGQLLRDGRLGLDDTVQQHLPDYPNPDTGRRVTVAQLLEHTSGLGDIFNDRYRETPKDELVQPRDFFPLFAHAPLAFEPGTSQEYSNAGYVVLGAIVEAVTGRDYAGWVEKHVFEPAGMADSGFLRKVRGAPGLAVGYTRLSPSGERGELAPNLGRLPVQGCPAGSSSHTARDLLSFDRALRSGALLGPWTGWFFGDAPPAPGTTPAPAEAAGYGIAGGGPGVNAALESEGGVTVVVLANLDPPVADWVAEQLRRAADRLDPSSEAGTGG